MDRDSYINKYAINTLGVNNGEHLLKLLCATLNILND